MRAPSAFAQKDYKICASVALKKRHRRRKVKTHEAAPPARCGLNGAEAASL
jgi:hypothetical protein